MNYSIGKSMKNLFSAVCQNVSFVKLWSISKMQHAISNYLPIYSLFVCFWFSKWTMGAKLRYPPWWRWWIFGSHAASSWCRHGRWSRTRPADAGPPHSAWRWPASCPACSWPGTWSAPPLLKAAQQHWSNEESLFVFVYLAHISHVIHLPLAVVQKRKKTATSPVKSAKWTEHERLKKILMSFNKNVKFFQKFIAGMFPVAQFLFITFYSSIFSDSKMAKRHFKLTCKLPFLCFFFVFLSMLLFFWQFVM